MRRTKLNLRRVYRSSLVHLAPAEPQCKLAVGYPAVSVGKHYCTGGEEAIGKTTAIREKARRVLQGAAVEAYGRPGAYVTRDPVMRRARVLDLEEFRAVAEYLEEKGWISEADDDYGIFVVTPTGLEEATG